MNADWFQIRSWHIVRFVSRGNAPKALCGKWGAANAPTFQNLGSTKSCESCLRIYARLVDQPI